MPSAVNTQTDSIQTAGSQAAFPDGAIAKGTVTLNGATPVVVVDADFTATTPVNFTLKTVGGTVGAHPSIKTVTPGTGFTVAGTASDTSVFNYYFVA